jgi:hypothetical protein
MVRVPLVTSIPPSLSRLTPDGTDLGPAYLERCRQSWRAAGFEPVSVNSAREVEKFGADFTGVRMVVAARDASAETGKPLVYFHDLLAAAISVAHDGPVALTNADVLLEGGELAAQVSAIRPGHAVFSRRIDVATPLSRDGLLYAHGIDFFGVHAQDLVKLQDGGFVFGAPWWDYYFPGALVASGVTLRPLFVQPAYHLRHEERWDPAQWRLFGSRFLEHVPALLRDGRATQAHDYLRRLDRLLGRGGLAARSERVLTVLAARALPSLAGHLQRRTLNGVSLATNAFLDGLPAS